MKNCYWANQLYWQDDKTSCLLFIQLWCILCAIRVSSIMGAFSLNHKKRAVFIAASFARSSHSLLSWQRGQDLNLRPPEADMSPLCYMNIDRISFLKNSLPCPPFSSFSLSMASFLVLYSSMYINNHGRYLPVQSLFPSLLCDNNLLLKLAVNPI